MTRSIVSKILPVNLETIGCGVPGVLGVMFSEKISKKQEKAMHHGEWNSKRRVLPSATRDTRTSGAREIGFERVSLHRIRNRAIPMDSTAGGAGGGVKKKNKVCGKRTTKQDLWNKVEGNRTI